MCNDSNTFLYTSFILCTLRYYVHFVYFVYTLLLCTLRLFCVHFVITYPLFILCTLRYYVHFGTFCRGSGQVCSATSRVLIHKDIKEAVMTRLLERVAAIRIGDSLDQSMVDETGPTMGPVINKVQYDKIMVSNI